MTLRQLHRAAVRHVRVGCPEETAWFLWWARGLLTDIVRRL